MASIVGVSIGDVPDGRPDQPRASWEDIQGWLSERGWVLINFEPDAPGRRLPAPRGIPYILCGSNLSGLGHAVVALDGQVIHDPHRGGAQLATVDAVQWLIPCVDARPPNLPIHELWGQSPAPGLAV